MMEPETIDDTSRTDAYAAGRRRALQAREMWKPVLAGAVASLAISAAIWAVLPRFEVRDVVVPRVTYKDAEVPRLVPHDVQVDHVIPHNVPIEIPVPRIVEAERSIPRETPSASAIAPRSSVERHFEASPEWRGAVIRGRIIRAAPPNGMLIDTENGEAPFYPARAGAAGPEIDSTMLDDITGLEGRLAICRQIPNKTYICVSLAPDGREAVIPQRPIGEPL
jgi:hypothetical protein